VIEGEKIALYFCRMDNAVSRIEELKLDPFGNILNWPPRFFGDEMGDLIAISKAAVKRQGANRS
jgi:hypothetical protein